MAYAQSNISNDNDGSDDMEGQSDDLVAKYGQGRALTTTDEYIDSLYPTLIHKPILTFS